MSGIVPDTKQKLVDTALALIWSNSYGSVSVDDICRTASVKKGSFYHFFPSKVDLAAAAMEQSYLLAKPAYDAIFSAETPPVQRFEKLADFIYDSQKQIAERHGKVCGCACSSLGSEMAGLEAGIKKKFDEVTCRQLRFYENALRDMVADGTLPGTVDIKAKAQEVNAYIVGQLMMARIQNDLDDLKRDLKPGLLRTVGVAARSPELV